MKSQLSKLWERVIKELDTTRYFTASEINGFFKDFKYDCETNFGLETIKGLEDEKNNRTTSVTVNGNSRCFDFTKKPKDIEKLIKDIKDYSEYPSEKHRLAERAKECVTFNDMLVFLQEELIGKKCRGFDDIRWDISCLLQNVNKNLYAVNDSYSKKEILVFLDCGKREYYWAGNRGHISYENPLLFRIEVSREVVAKHHSWCGNSIDYAIKSISPKTISMGTTLKEAYDEWKAKEDAKNNAEDIKANAFLESLKEHGFESLEDLKAFIANATSAQKKQFC